jgi:hypothetical protein
VDEEEEMRRVMTMRVYDECESVEMRDAIERDDLNSAADD